MRTCCTATTGVAEALEGAREVHQEERDAAQAAEAGAVADRKLVARNARLAAQKAKKTLDEVKAEYEHKLKRLQETEAAEKKNTAEMAFINAELKTMFLKRAGPVHATVD